MMPEEEAQQEQIQTLLDRIQPKPGPHFHQYIQTMPWAQVSPKRKFSWRRLGIPATLITIFVLLISLATPSLEVVAQRLAQLFRASTGNHTTVQVPLEEINNSQLQFSLTISEAETLAGFEVLKPGYVPPGYTLEGAAYQAERQAIITNYVMENNGHSFRISQRPQGIDYQQIGAGALIEIVQIGAISGEYVTGAWTIPEVESALEETANSQSPTLEIAWNPEAGVQILRWQKDKMLFEILFAGRNSDILGYLTKSDLIAIAESMH